MVGLNEQGLVHDFYYPYVGLDNLTTSRSVHHSIGVWVDGTFSWIDEKDWQVNVDFESDALVSSINAQNNKLNIELQFNDFVDNKQNILCRMITVKNQSDHTRDIRVFMHQVFQISRSGRADTALFVPDDNYIIDYKGRCSLLIYGRQDDNDVFDQFAVGNYGIEGKEGTFRDAEDGELSGSAVEHGGVDSVIRFKKHLKPNGISKIEYWIVAADSQYSAHKIHESLLRDGLQNRLDNVREYWSHWLSRAESKLSTLDKDYIVPVKKSLLIIKAHADSHGGIIASGDSSIYNYGRDYYSYVWPRDGCYAIWPLIRLGYTEEPRKFFEFCRDIITTDGYLMHKFQPDRALGSTWHPMLHKDHRELPIQEDETAIVICMIAEYLSYAKDEEYVKQLYPTFIQPALNFLSEFVDDDTGLPHASYDLWEEKFLTTTYTIAVVCRALTLGVEFAEKFEYSDDISKWQNAARAIKQQAGMFFDQNSSVLRKGFLLNRDGTIEYNNTLDVSSMYGAMMFRLFDDVKHDFIQKTIAAIETQLLDSSPSGGCPRYSNDAYFRSEPAYLGNPWIVTTLWISQFYARTHNIAKARKLIDWSLTKTLPSGVLSEQINPETSQPVSVTPLVWSHAELINSVLDLSIHENNCKHIGLNLNTD